MPDISIKALPPVGMIALRGDLGKLGEAVSAATGCPPPSRRMRTHSGGTTVLWMSPDELLLTCAYADATDLAADLAARLAEAFATVAVVSDARQVFDLTGDGIRETLSKLCPVDFDALQPDEVRRTRLAQISAAFWRHDDGWRLMCFRSVSRYAADLLDNAAA